MIVADTFFKVKTAGEVLEIITGFGPLGEEVVSLDDALDRVTSTDEGRKGRVLRAGVGVISAGGNVNVRRHRRQRCEQDRQDRDSLCRNWVTHSRVLLRASYWVVSSRSE